MKSFEDSEHSEVYYGPLIMNKLKPFNSKGVLIEWIDGPEGCHPAEYNAYIGQYIQRDLSIFGKNITHANGEGVVGACDYTWKVEEWAEDLSCRLDGPERNSRTIIRVKELS